MTNTRARSFGASRIIIGRRRLLQLGAGTAAYLAFARRGWPFAQSPTNIRKFITNLPGVGPTGLTFRTSNRQFSRNYRSRFFHDMNAVSETPSSPST
jgi:hypothetical protein